MQRFRGFLFEGKLTERLSLERKHIYIFLGIAVFLVAVFLRFYHLSSLPPGVYPDEAVNGTDAIEANESGHYRLFYSNNYGREGLFMNLIAWGFLFFGVNVITLKMWAAIFGILTVLGMILLARELFGTWRGGLVAGFLYATSYWAINFNRISFRANMLPFVLVFSFYFLWRSLRTKKLSDAIFSGLFFGLGLHTYIAFRIAPAIFVALFAALLLSRKKFLKNYWKHFAAFLVAAAIVALPMLVNFYLNPQYFETRSESVSVLSPKVNQGHLVKALGTSVILSLGMFNFYGDQNWRHNLPTYPELELFAGILFLIGFFWIVLRFVHYLYLRIRKKKYREELALDTLLLSWFAAMLLPGILTYEGLPHSLRVIGTLPVVYLFAVFTVEKIFQYSDRLTPKIVKFSAYSILIAILAWSGYVSVRRYFVEWAGSVEVHAAFSQNFKNMALYLNNLPPNLNKYVVTNASGQIMDDGLPVSAHVIKLLTHYNTPGILYLRSDFDTMVLKSPARIVLMNYDGQVIARIKEKFPYAQVQKLDPQPGNGTDYFVININ